MKKVILLSIIFLSLYSCKVKTVYVPVETVRVEYENKVQRDSFNIHDSIYIREKSDTVFYTRFKTIYRDRNRTDTIYKNVTQQVPYEVIKYQNKLSKFQRSLIFSSALILLIIIIYLFFKLKFVFS